MTVSRKGAVARLLACVAVLVFAQAAAAQSAVFGPRDYTRKTAKPEIERATFAATAAPGYTFRFANGGASSQYAKTTSAVVKLNGLEILGPKDFNAKTPVVIEKTVALLAANAIEVELRGDPGAGATITIVGTVVDDDLPTIVANVSPVPNAAGWNRTPVTVTFTCADATSGIASCTDPVTVAAEGPGHSVIGNAEDIAGNRATATLTVNIDTMEPQLQARIPVANDGRTNAAKLRVTGFAYDNYALRGVTVNGTPATLNGDNFEAEVVLNDGANALRIVASDLAGNEASYETTVVRYSIPVVTITSPADLAVVRTATVTVSGTVNEPVASVTVNGTVATVTGTTFTASGVPLAQGRTVVTATAVDAQGHTGTTSAIFYRDSIPPRVVVRYPEDGMTVYQSPIDVSGMVDDLVVGTINSAQMRVTVNGAPAELSNRAFVARDVALSHGLNTLTIVATDQGGNAITIIQRVTYDDAAGRAKIEIVSGDNQRAAIGATLPVPLRVRLTNADGSRAANRTVAFEVVENNGQLRGASGVPAALVTATTDAAGEATAIWTLGMRAGAGNNRVAASASGFAGVVEFQAIADMGAPAMIVVDSGNNQFGAMGSPLARPLVAVVVDAGSNRVANVPVRFTVADGGGNFAGQESVTVTTDSDGRAIVHATLGRTGSNLFRAAVDGVERTASFVAVGKIAGDADATSIAGVILDNTDTPIAGVSVRVDGTELVTETGDNGQFTIPGVPVGYVKLLIDGSTARRPGTWPTLEFAMYTIPGAKNTLEMPIYLLPVDVRRGLFTDEVTGGTLTLPELPGFALTVKPGSATFPGGGRTGTVSVTLVHADKMPMPPGFGQQPRFIVTIQPPGVHFDPPAAISFPNVDGLAPNAVTEMYSFDHDLGQFVAIGTATVSADGAQVQSDPGVGIIKGGWHCGGDPSSSGTTADCPDCKKCENDQCVPDPSKFCNSCGSPAGRACDKDGSCRSGMSLLGMPEVCQTVDVGYHQEAVLVWAPACGETNDCFVGARYRITNVSHGCDSISLEGGSLTESITVVHNTCGPISSTITGSKPIGAGNAINSIDDFFYCEASTEVPSECLISMVQNLYIGSCEVDTRLITIEVLNSGVGCNGQVQRQSY